MEPGRIIGDIFEEHFHSLFPELIDFTGSEDVVPDFYHPSGFWVEAKAGYWEWGCRPKKKQVDAHSEILSKLGEPVIHALGIHDFYGSMSLPQKTDWGKKRYLKEHMNFTSITFVGQEIMEGVLGRGQKLNGNGTIEYCMLKPSMLRNILLDRKGFSFNKIRADSADKFFGFNRGDYTFLGGIHERVLPLDYCMMLNHKTESVVRDYFLEKCSFDG